MILQPLLTATGFPEELQWWFSLAARPSPTVPHSLQSDLGETDSNVAGQPSPTPNPKGLEPARSPLQSPDVEWKLRTSHGTPLETHSYSGKNITKTRSWLWNTAFREPDTEPLSRGDFRSLFVDCSPELFEQMNEWHWQQIRSFPNLNFWFKKILYQPLLFHPENPPQQWTTMADPHLPPGSECHSRIHTHTLKKHKLGKNGRIQFHLIIFC